jgi:hypothetical protein
MMDVTTNFNSNSALTIFKTYYYILIHIMLIVYTPGGVSLEVITVSVGYCNPVFRFL